MDKFDVANEVEWALAKYTNWDNLFLSENFKKNIRIEEIFLMMSVI